MRRLGPGARVVKTSLAAGLSWAVATHVSQNDYPYFAPLTAILTLQATIADSLARALYRLAGVVGGVIVSMLIGYWLHTGAVTIALAIFLGMALSAALRLNSQITSQVAVTALLVLVSRDSRHYAVDRIFETALGALVAIAVNAVIVPPNEIPLAEGRIQALTDLLAKALRDLADGVRDRDLIEDIKERTEDALQVVELAEQGLKLTPFLRSRRARLQRLAAIMTELEKIAIQVRGVVRGLADLEVHGEASAGLRDALRDTSECVAAFGKAALSPTEDNRRSLEATVARALSSHRRYLASLTEAPSPVVLRDLGAVFADLNRILTEVAVG